MSSSPTPFKSNVVKWLALGAIAAGLLLAYSGVCIHQLADVPSYWLVASSIAAFSWLFLLIRLRAFSQPHRLLFLVGTVVGFNLLAQSTGGEQSPLIFGIFLLMGIAAWEGDAKYGYLVAILFSGLEYIYIYLRKEDDPQGLVLYLRWAAYLVSASFLARVVKTRREKEQLNSRLESLKNDADQLASEAEPSSFNIPKDRLLMEEGRLSARVGTVMELEEALARQLGLFQKSLPIHTAVFFLLTTVEEKKVLRLRASSTLSKDIASDVTLLPGETLVGLAAKEGRRVLLNDIAPESARALPYYLKPNPIGAFLAQPIHLKSNPGEEGEDERELVGVLVLDHEKPNYFQERELALSEQFSEMLAETIQNTRILHFSRAKTRNLHALYDVSNSFSTLLDLDQVLKTALNTAKEISPCDSAYMALTEGDGRKFAVRAWWGHARAEKPQYLEDELAAWVWETKKPIRYTRGQKEKGLVSFAKREGMLGSTQSFLMVPLLAGEDILGVIRLNSQKPATYQAYDQDVLTTLANQTAMALKNAINVLLIQEMAVRDGLTGVYNHRYFQEKLAEEMVKAERYNKDLSLALLDVDHFKKFNDSYGHQEGDRVLRVVAEVIQNTVRHKIDTVARYGGEEFAVILPESDGNAGKELAERIRKNVESHLFENDGKTLYRVTISVGVASYPFDSRDQKGLIQSADHALYESKKAGRNQVKRFSATKPTYENA